MTDRIYTKSVHSTLGNTIVYKWTRGQNVDMRLEPIELSCESNSKWVKIGVPRPKHQFLFSEVEKYDIYMVPEALMENAKLGANNDKTDETIVKSRQNNII